MKISLKALGLAAIVLLVGQSVSAKDLFVALTGNDTVTYANNSITSPWATPAKAWAEARAGDTVFFRGGTYLVTETINTKYTGHDGTATAPITFTHYGNESVVIDGTIPSGPLILIERSYHHLVGLTIRARIGGSGWVVQVGYDLPVANHVKITRCTLEFTAGGWDNTACVHLYNKIANFAEVSHCRMSGNQIGNGVIAFRTQGARIFNNEFTNLGHGVYWKHSNALADAPELQVQITNNVFRNLPGSGVYGNPNRALIQNNLMIQCAGGVSFGDDGGPGDGYVGADENIIRHNTLVNCGIGFTYESRSPSEDPNRGCLRNIIENNVVMGPMHLHPYTAPRDASGVPIPGYDYDTHSNWNLYPDRPDLFVENRTNYSLAQWRTYNGTDAQSLTGQPVFVGGAAPTTIAGFALAAGSPGKNAGSDGKDLGADVSRVGIQIPASLTITSPNGGEAWRRGETRQITWSITGATGGSPLRIEFLSGDTVLGNIATDVDAAAGSFTWTVGRLADGTFRTGPNLKIRISTVSGHLAAARGMR
ncbi:MAG: NosD domain-containing protein [Holophaga sp.]|nr:NosD domain-containing protein [Holophaga sp.]